MLRFERKPDITFITPTYKFDLRCDALRECIGSVLAQKYENWEHLICTQNECRKTKLLVAHYKDHRIKYCFTTQTGRSGNKQRNYMIRQARGEWLHFLDDDNIIYDNFLERLNDEFDVQHDLIIIKILHSYMGMKPFPKHRWGNPKALRVMGVDSLNIIVRNAVAKAIGWKDIGRVGGDGYFASRVVSAIGGNRVKYVNEVLAKHRNLFGKRGRNPNKKKK